MTVRWWWLSYKPFFHLTKVSTMPRYLRGSGFLVNMISVSFAFANTSSIENATSVNYCLKAIKREQYPRKNGTLNNNDDVIKRADTSPTKRWINANISAQLWVFLHTSS
jgi:hypothetical protein